VDKDYVHEMVEDHEDAVKLSSGFQEAKDYVAAFAQRRSRPFASLDDGEGSEKTL